MHCTQRKIRQNAIFGKHKMFIHFECFQDKMGNEEAGTTSFRFMHFFTAGFLNTTDNQPVDRLTQSRLLISLLLLVNNHLEIQNRSSKAEKAGGVLPSPPGDIKSWLLGCEC